MGIDITNTSTFNRWRSHVAHHLPSLSRRVFALRGRPYTGSGFHCDLEAELGYVISIINAYNESYPDGVATRMAIEVRLHCFMGTLREAEKSAEVIASRDAHLMRFGVRIDG